MRDGEDDEFALFDDGDRETPRAEPTAPSNVDPTHNTDSPAGSGTISPGSVAFFVMKSLKTSLEDVARSVLQNVWATQRRNEARLNHAFHNKERVLLIFSVNESKAFQGFARMLSPTGT